MTEQQSPKYVPVRVYISEKQYRKLKAELALKGLSVSEWFRQKAQSEING